ncbi:MAG: hypothetical protein ABIJ43_05255 [Candidatus Beckwithbacteria bacterium]|nr:hypothetical protein [Patescibacteria group bacterium]
MKENRLITQEPTKTKQRDLRGTMEGYSMLSKHRKQQLKDASAEALAQLRQIRLQPENRSTPPTA